MTITRNPNRAGGFTLAELILAITITSMVAVAVAGATMALYSAYRRSEGFNDSLQTARAATRMLQAMVVEAQLITAVEPGGFAVWRDTNGDDLINLTELVPVIHDPATNTIKKYIIEYPPEWSQEMRDSCDYSIVLKDATDLDEVVNRITGDAHHRIVTLAENIETFAVYARAPGPVNTFLETTVQAKTDSRAITLTTGATMEDHAVDRLQFQGGHWILCPPE